MSSSEHSPPTAAGSAGRAGPTSSATPARIAEWVAALDTVNGLPLAELPLAEHVEAYQRLHIDLQAALAQIDGP